MKFRGRGGPQSDDWTAVLIASGRLLVVRVALRDGASPRVLACERFAWEEGEVDALKRAKSHKNLWAASVTTVLDHGQYRLQQFDFPEELRTLSQVERREAMRWRVKEMVDFPIEDAGIDVFEMPAVGSRSAQLWVVAAPKAVLEQRIQAFQEARIPLSTIDIPELAQRNLASFFQQEHRGVALLSFAREGGLLTITHDDQLFVARHIDVGAEALIEVGQESLRERVALDVQRTLDNFDRNYGAIPLTSLHLAPLPGGEALVAYFGDNLSLPIERVDLAQVLDFSAVPALKEIAAQAEVWFALGAALREAMPEKSS